MPNKILFRPQSSNIQITRRRILGVPLLQPSLFQYTAKFKDISMENRPTPKEWRNLRKGIKQAQLYLGMDKFSSYADFAMTLSKFLEPTNDVKSLETKRLLIKAYPDWERLIPLTEINEQIKRLKAWELTDADRTLLEQIRHKTQN